MPIDSRPWDALSRADNTRYSYTLYCTAIACGRGTIVDPGAMIERVGDRTWQWVREHARCAACGHRGASVIMAPRWTGPVDLEPKP